MKSEIVKSLENKGSAADSGLWRIGHHEPVVYLRINIHAVQVEKSRNQGHALCKHAGCSGQPEEVDAELISSVEKIKTQIFSMSRMNRNMKIIILEVYDGEPVPPTQQMEYAFDCDHAKPFCEQIGV